ncbi:hypothetical protein FHX08_003606 [Rhizobium sp. BK529]|uniref:hypothetical protein n=1 Tax=unclassified Rhizobium TaxID=2613769 RepID=UPI001044D7F7|nr:MULTISPECIES: hypothetical protein [unclassified Rhizobium]MBB3593203.1 hypothetical protein [Rhizobium sp. BK529]
MQTIERIIARLLLFCVAVKGFQLNISNSATASAERAPRDQREGADRLAKNQKPYPCLLTRAELKAIILEQLG